jgi:Ca-activated chloride channel family protein
MNLREFFAWPGALPLLALVPLLWLLLRTFDGLRSRQLVRVVGPRAQHLARDLAPGQRRLRRVLSWSGLLCALLAVMQPLWGEDVRKVEQRGVDMLVCLDVSRSMLARDLPPSRLLRARREIRALAERVRGDRMGLVAFAGEARLTVPLTQDMDSFAGLVEMADPLSVRRGGTDLGAALDKAIEALEGQTGDHEAVLLITDGEDLEQKGLRAAEKCKEKKITVHCIGFGSAQGSKITVDGQTGESFLRDRSGKEVVSAMDPTSLRKIAETTGGEFIDAGTMPLPLLELYEKRILPMARKTFEAEERREKKNRFQWPLLAAFVLWILELCLTDRKRR